MIVVLDTSISDVGIYIKDGKKVLAKGEQIIDYGQQSTDMKPLKVE